MLNQKKIMKIKNIILVFYLVVSSQLEAQTIDGQPGNFNDKVPVCEAYYIAQKINNEQEANNELIRQANSIDKMKFFGKELAINLDFFHNAELFVKPNGDKLYQFGLKSAKAYSINLIFDDFYLEEGTKLYLTNKNRTEFIGAYSALNNNEAKVLGSELLNGDDMVLLFEEPKTALGTSTLTIRSLVHAFEDLDDIVEKGLNSSGDCNYDVNCPEGMGFESQRNSVAMMVSGGGFCTGSLVFNTSGTVIPYFLTARHCGTNPTSWVFRFRWEAPAGQTVCAQTGNSGNGPENKNVNGAVMRAENNTSDFILCELNAEPDPSWGVYYNGWDRRENVTVSSGVGIHHPDGDIKKISKDHDPLVQQTISFAGAQNRTWRVNNWELGTTEGGSSGSPLYNQDKRMVGVLSGGLAACSGTSGNGESDYYGRFGYAWDNGPTVSKRLKEWLDPGGTGAEFIDGKNPANGTDSLDASLSNLEGLKKASCDSVAGVKFTLSNSGTNVLNSIKVDYGFDGSLSSTYTWNGTLQTFETVVINLQITLPAGAHDFALMVMESNGQVDQNTLNNKVDKSFLKMNDDVTLNFLLDLDCYANETSWALTDTNDEIIYSGGGYANNSNPIDIQENLCVEEGCYKIKIFDSYGDGMTTCDPNEGGNGSFVLSDNFSGEIYAEMTEAQADFGSEFVRDFCVEIVGIEEFKSLSSLVQLYPNPSNGELNITSKLKIEKILIRNLEGKVLMTSTVAKLNLSEYPSSVYLIEVQMENTSAHLRWVKQ
jgi:lysyl endopeptidase